jgi:hypothetical protein
LNRFSHREVEVVTFLPSDEAAPSDNMGSATPTVALDKEYLLPQAPMRVNAEKSLADGDKYHQV